MHRQTHVDEDEGDHGHGAVRNEGWPIEESRDDKVPNEVAQCDCVNVACFDGVAVGPILCKGMRSRLEPSILTHGGPLCGGQWGDDDGVCEGDKVDMPLYACALGELLECGIYYRSQEGRSEVYGQPTCQRDDDQRQVYSEIGKAEVDAIRLDGDGEGG